ncbi:MAG: Adenylate cyclase [Devosia sp.]|uniref:winged helix-turn-helix domain-containing tetratricopeptide repeat protein n=1 Tax=Devosia sp. TaxID=1871048 RepID=UPI0026146661|nr:tetratricopeptide repeat protein [Devosia sp.]MDB5539678.1 Adenylate cyclase [Devosia sp.]
MHNQARQAVDTGWIEFGPFRFDRGSRTLWRDGALMQLGGRGAALLQALLEADGAVVPKDALIARAWPGIVVEESNLAVQIGGLRKVLGRRDDGSVWIATAARAGYQLVREAAGNGEGKGMPAIAVLPFVAMDEVGSFADGFVEDLLTALSRFKTFAVAARTSAEAFRNGGTDVRKIARTLGVRYVIEGSVRRTGDRIRLTAQLIDGANGLHLWSEKLDGTLEDIFDFQDRLVAGVVMMFEPYIRQAEIERARRKRPENLDAYDLYLKALALMRGVVSKTLDTFDEAINLLDQAIALDPGFAPALALCAGAHESRLTHGGVAPQGVDDRRELLELSERALAADSNDANVLMTTGTNRLMHNGDETGGFPLLLRAEALNPNSLVVANVTAFCFWHAGRTEESIARFSRVIAMARTAPEVVWPMSGLSQAYLSAGRFEEALHWGLRVLERTDKLDFAHCQVVAAYAHLGRQADAEARLRKTLALWPDLTVERLIGPKATPRARFRFLEEGLLKAGLPAI